MLGPVLSVRRHRAGQPEDSGECSYKDTHTNAQTQTNKNTLTLTLTLTYKHALALSLTWAPSLALRVHSPSPQAVIESGVVPRMVELLMHPEDNVKVLFHHIGTTLARFLPD